jgi:hypothetical protein
MQFMWAELCQFPLHESYIPVSSCMAGLTDLLSKLSQFLYLIFGFTSDWHFTGVHLFMMRNMFPLLLMYTVSCPLKMHVSSFFM